MTAPSTAAPDMTTGGCGEPAVERAGWGMFTGGSDRQRRELRDSGRSEACRDRTYPFTRRSD